MRKLLFLVVAVLAGTALWRRFRGRGAQDPAPVPAAPVQAVRPTPPPAPERREDPAPAPPRPTTNGERVVLTSVWTLEQRAENATPEAVVNHLAAGEIDPDEGTVDVLLHRLQEAGLLEDVDGAYRLTAMGQAALQDGSSARPAAAGGAADELSTPGASA